jgi:hypothetical protein
MRSVRSYSACAFPPIARRPCQRDSPSAAITRMGGPFAFPTARSGDAVISQGGSAGDGDCRRQESRSGATYVRHRAEPEPTGYVSVTAIHPPRFVHRHRQAQAPSANSLAAYVSHSSLGDP